MHFQRGRGYAGGLQRAAQFGFSPAVGDHKIRPAEAFHAGSQEGAYVHRALAECQQLAPVATIPV